MDKSQECRREKQMCSSDQSLGPSRSVTRRIGQQTGVATGVIQRGGWVEEVDDSDARCGKQSLPRYIHW